MSIIRRAGVVIAIATTMLAIPMATFACEPYTFADEEDWFGLSGGVQWAFAAEVIEEIPNPQIPHRFEAVLLRVHETLIGAVASSRLLVRQDQGCDGFWYRKGDHVVAAIGRMRGVDPPFDGITNYQVAVWVVRDGVIVRGFNPHAGPWVAGRAPVTERQLRALLLSLPDTATVPLAELAPPWTWAVLLPAFGAAVGAAAVWRRPARRVR